MKKTSVSIRNMDRPAPRWFRRTKKAVLILVVAANSMVASWGLDNELLVTRIQLWCTIGVGAILEALGTLLGNGENYTVEKRVQDDQSA